MKIQFNLKKQKLYINSQNLKKNTINEPIFTCKIYVIVDYTNVASMCNFFFLHGCHMYYFILIFFLLK